MEASDPFKIQKLENKDLFMRSSNDIDLEEDDNVNANNNNSSDSNENDNTKLTQLYEALDLKIEEAFITFCEETGPDLQPLAVLKLDINGRISNWTKNLHCKADLSLEASYYNDRLR